MQRIKNKQSEFWVRVIKSIGEGKTKWMNGDKSKIGYDDSVLVIV